MTSIRSTVHSTIEYVARKKNEWAAMPSKQRVALLDQCMQNLKKEAPAMAQTCLKLRGGDPKDPRQVNLLSHAWGSSAMPFASWLSELRDIWEHIDKTGRVPVPLKVSTRRGGNVMAKVGPRDWLTYLLTGCPSFEIHLENGQEFRQAESPLVKPAGVVGILGPGNYEIPVDILTAMFINNQVVIFKVNPVCLSYVAHLRNILAPLLALDFLAIVEGGVEEAKAVVESKLVEQWILTGSALTFNRLMWGADTPPSPVKGKPPQPLMDKPYMAELGGCSPVIISPDGGWSELDLGLHAGHLAVFTMFNGGHICVRPQCIVTCKNWPQRQRFLALLRKKIEASPAWSPYYPGAANKMKLFADALIKEGKSPSDFLLTEPHSQAVFPGRPAMIFATDVSHTSYCLKEEAFCPVLVEVCLDTPPTAEAFLPAAAEFANKNLVGNLSATIIHKVSRANSHVLEEAIDTLQYGIVGVNVNGINAITQPTLGWGAAPGNPATDIKSGSGWLGNALLIEKPNKTVIRVPFYNLALVAQRVVSSPLSTQTLKIFSRLARTFMDKSINMSPVRFLGWLVLCSVAVLFNI